MKFAMYPVTPPTSPLKCPASSPCKVASSPPTPHKITLVDHGYEANGRPPPPRAPALKVAKLRFSFSPGEKGQRKNRSSPVVNGTSASSTAAKRVTRARKGANQLQNGGHQTNTESACNGVLSVRSPKSSTPSSPAPSRAPLSTKQQKLEQAAQNNHKVTEYFPIRRSNRKSKAKLQKEMLEDIEHHLMDDDDTQLDIRVESFVEKGRGVISTRPFSKGEFVVEYVGDLIDVDSAKEREAKYSLDLATGCYMYYFKHKAKQYCIDATRESGRIGRLVNHSRLHPNLQTKVVMFKDKPRLILIAKKDIEEGEELLYDYGDRSKESLKAHPWLAL